MRTLPRFPRLFLIVLLSLFLFPLTLDAQSGMEEDVPGKADRAGKAEQRQRRGAFGQQGQQGKRRRQRGQQGQRQMDPAKVFARFDQNSDGVITSDEMPERIRQRMSAADTNDDGLINGDEFKAHLQKSMNRRGNGQRPGQRQRKGKGNGNGKAKDMQGQQRRGQFSLRQPENINAEQVMSRFDQNDNGSLEKSEIPRMMASKMVKFDEDGDETVSMTELRSAIETMKAKAMDAGKGRYSTDPNSSKGQVPKRPGSSN